jgi:diguanylate cyclase (GGDEF)-like protein/hemerythrin-like metal-binding protein
MTVPEPEKILVVDDTPMNLEVLLGILEHEYDLSFATSGPQALDLLALGARPDLILLDVMMPGMDGYEVCAALKANPATRDIPVIFVTAKTDADSETQALKAGGVDFIHKPVNGAVVRARVRLHLELKQTLKHLQHTHQELLDAYAKLERMASTDTLTGAWNRQRLDEAVTAEMERLNRYGHPLSLMILDIDHFKKINDNFGHVTGDRVLLELVATVRSTLRAMDSLTRWGGEEFVVLNPNTPLLSATMMADRLREVIAKAIFSSVGQITVSIGVAECLPGEAWEHWLNRADAALYRAKTGGRNQVQLAPERPEQIGLGEVVGAKFLQLHWRSIFECGQPLIDSQHRGLFEDANDLLIAVLSGHPTDEVATLVDHLIRDVIQHFADEEAIFMAAGYPDAAKHAAIHRDLLDRAGVLVGHFQAGALGIGELFQFLAHDLVALHMLRSDREFFPYVTSQPPENHHFVKSQPMIDLSELGG